MSTLALFNRFSGEVAEPADAQSLLRSAGLDDLRLAQMDELAEFVDLTRELQSIAAEARNIASGELVRRLDHEGRWTWRDEHYEVRAPSPEAGTVSYDLDRLRDALSQLVAADVVSRDAARSAVAQHEHSVAVSYDFLRRLRRILGASTIEGDVDRVDYDIVEGEVDELLRDEPQPRYFVRPTGVRNLLKIPAAREAIESCRVRTATRRPRAARVKRLGPAR